MDGLYPVVNQRSSIGKEIIDHLFQADIKGFAILSIFPEEWQHSAGPDSGVGP